MLKKNLQNDLKNAMKAKEAVRVSVIRQVLAAIKTEEIAERVADLPDETARAVLRREARKRKEAIEIYDKAGRPERAETERRELEIISSYLPAPLTDAELGTVIQKALRSVKPQSMKDFGEVMGAVLKETAGRRDASEVAGLVKAAMTSPK